VPLNPPVSSHVEILDSLIVFIYYRTGCSTERPFGFLFHAKSAQKEQLKTDLDNGLLKD
jgi:hypothetical protein